jgi:ABC-2 type transport system ATP-binding protein
MENNVVIRVKGITKKYHTQTAVDDLYFEVKEGEIFGFLGPNGAGKTTTLLMLMGLTQPSAGSAEIFGLNPLRKPLEVKKLVGYLPEHVGFYGDMNAIQSLQYVANLNGLRPGGKTDELVLELLELVGLSNELNKNVANFSRGMQQRLGIAEVLIKNPKILFLDEPTLGLDPDGALKLIELISSLNRDRKITVVLSSHNLQQVQKVSNRVGIMINGKMVAEGSIESLGKQKLGLDEKEYSLEEIYLKYFREV